MINISKKLVLFTLLSVLFLAGSLVPVPVAQAVSVHHVYAGENIEDEIALMDPGDVLIVHKGTYDTTVAGGSHEFPIIVDVSITIIAVDGRQRRRGGIRAPGCLGRRSTLALLTFRGLLP